MIINSDWHIHSEYSYDASNSLERIAEAAIAQGLSRIGITDHLNSEKLISIRHIRSICLYSCVLGSIL